MLPYLLVVPILLGCSMVIAVKSLIHSKSRLGVCVREGDMPAPRSSAPIPIGKFKSIKSLGSIFTSQASLTAVSTRHPPPNWGISALSFKVQSVSGFTEFYVGTEFYEGTQFCLWNHI